MRCALSGSPWFIFASAPLTLVTLFPWDSPAFAQPITPAADGTGTQVNTVGNRHDITGGTQAGANLFHSFGQFNVPTGNTANFVGTPNLANILGRVTGGSPSLIDGLLQVSNSNANLFLMNPAGMIFGANASLNLPGSFTATTATGIGFGEGTFNAFGPNNFSSLVSAPTQFNFATETGPILNLGHLSVTEGNNLWLVGGSVLNVGTLEAPGGNITLAAIPEERQIQIRQEGMVLDLVVEAAPAEFSDSSDLRDLFQPIDLPGALTGGNIDHVNSLTVTENGRVFLGSSPTPFDLKEPGTTIVSGNIDTSGEVGGTIDILGDRVGILEGILDASGQNGGGRIRVGGDYQGQGTIPNAVLTAVTTGSILDVSAIDYGDGGEVIVWADGFTGFYGSLSAKGGALGGDGGFAEISGKQSLGFAGEVNLLAPSGSVGTILFDPTDIVVGTDGTDGANSGAINFNTNPSAEPWNVTPAQLDAVAGNVQLQATNDITFTDPVSLNTSGASLTATAGNDINVNADISTTNGAVTLTADGNNPGDNLGAITMASGTTINSGSGNITLSAPEGVTISNLTSTGTIQGGGGATVDSFTVTGTITGNVSLGGGNDSLTLNGGTVSGVIDGGGGTDTLTGSNNDESFDLDNSSSAVVCVG